MEGKVNEVSKTELLGVKGSWREVVDDCRATVGKESLGHEPELSDVLVPNCVYRGGCPEIDPCGFWENFYPVANTIQDRYDQYNALFYARREEQNA